MAHYQVNPRTNKYSKVKLILIRIELLLKKGFLFLFVLINFVLHTKKSKYIDIGDYMGKDSRFINYLFESLKSRYNFSYDISFATLDFIKKIGIRNFIFHATPNLLVKKKNKLKFNLLHFSTDQMYDSKIRSNSELSKIFIKNYYTWTKIKSEQICLKNNAIVLRTNFFGFSKKGLTFSDWVRKKFKSNKKFYLVDDVYFNPLSLTTISEIIEKIIKKKLFFSGIYNLGCKDKISKKDFAIKYAKLNKIYKKNYGIKKINKLVKTRRPNNMYMDIKKFQNKFKIKLPKLVNEIKKEISYIRS